MLCRAHGVIVRYWVSSFSRVSFFCPVSHQSPQPAKEFAVEQIQQSVKLLKSAFALLKQDEGAQRHMVGYFLKHFSRGWIGLIQPHSAQKAGQCLLFDFAA